MRPATTDSVWPSPTTKLGSSALARVSSNQIVAGAAASTQKPKSIGSANAIVGTSPPGRATKNSPPVKPSSSAVLTWNEPVTSSLALGPNTMPLGFRK